ncbi:hypothetical protein [Conexibacter arvalis]|uniref:Uncharacterized protein n=1 Tax=Conexibacter arvalis TaxID=912552 RepID=A0A840I8H4_9ACTN|nr:hypothetical protein [Conexibacter arvalis]MBB4661209.1 hypothetical protein [Conexibacter arvalis]
MLGADLTSAGRLRLLPLACLTLVVVAAALTSPLTLAMLAPALVLLGLLLAGRTPGEELILRLRRRRTARMPRAARTIERQYAVLLAQRPGRLIGCALAVRPPPAAAALTHAA